MVERGGVELLPKTNCSKKLKHSRVRATRSEEKKKRRGCETEEQYEWQMPRQMREQKKRED